MGLASHEVQGGSGKAERSTLAEEGEEGRGVLVVDLLGLFGLAIVVICVVKMIELVYNGIPMILCNVQL